MIRRLRRAVPWIYRVIFFAGISALGFLGTMSLTTAAGWLQEGFLLAGIVGVFCAVWVGALFVLLAFWTGPRLFVTWDRERAFDDARRCVRCDRGTRPLFRVQGVDGAACKSCLPLVEKTVDPPGIGPYAAPRRAREARL